MLTVFLPQIVHLVSQEGTMFKAAAACHPAMVDPEDAPKVTIPIAMLPSKDEDKDAVAKWEEKIKVKHLVNWFPNQVHGFMAARYVPWSSCLLLIESVCPVFS